MIAVKRTRQLKNPERLNGIECERAVHLRMLNAGWSQRHVTATELMKRSIDIDAAESTPGMQKHSVFPERRPKANDSKRLFLSVRSDKGVSQDKINAALEQYQWPLATKETAHQTPGSGATDGLTPEQRLAAIAEILATVALRAQKRKEQEKQDNGTT